MRVKKDQEQHGIQVPVSLEEKAEKKVYEPLNICIFK
jgi:hypothetical protein